MAVTPDGTGYFVVTEQGAVYTFGSAVFRGDFQNVHLKAPIVGIERTPSSQEYWLAGADGGIFAFGDAPFRGSFNDLIAKPVVDLASALLRQIGSEGRTMRCLDT